jgi:hypothetical protein
MGLGEIDRHPSAGKLATFGLLLPVFFAVAGGIARWRWELPTVAMAIWVGGGALVVLYSIVPSMRRPVYVGWMVAVMPIGVCVSYLVLAVTYFLVLTPIGLVRRLFGDPLQRRFDREAVTYWTPAKPRTDMRDYFKQF